MSKHKQQKPRHSLFDIPNKMQGFGAEFLYIDVVETPLDQACAKCKQQFVVDSIGVKVPFMGQKIMICYHIKCFEQHLAL